MNEIQSTPADDEAGRFIRRIDDATMRVPHGGDRAYETVDFRFARFKENHIRALRRAVLRVQEVLAGWEDKAAHASGVSDPAGGEPTIAERIQHAQTAIAAHDRAARPAELGNVTSLITGLLHTLTVDDSPADVIAAAVELYAHNHAAENPQAPSAEECYFGLASMVIATLLDGAASTDKGQVGLLHLALGETQA